MLEHYPEQRNKRGRIEHKATWDRVLFDTWKPRKILLHGQERVSLGEPDWRRMPDHEVEQLIGREEARGAPSID